MNELKLVLPTIVGGLEPLANLSSLVNASMLSGILVVRIVVVLACWMHLFVYAK